MSLAVNRKRRLIAACTITTSIAVVAAALEIIEEDESNERSFKKQKKEFLDFMKNNQLYARHRDPPQHPLVSRIVVDDLFKDPNRNYIHVFTSLFGWEFFMLADYLKPFIEVSRSDHTKPMGHRMKKDFRSRLYYTLFWLVTRTEYRQMEFYFGWAKSQFERDIPHVLLAIIRGLDAFICWPSVAERANMASMCTGLFRNCVGIIDANEVFINKSKNSIIEASSYSGKAGGNTKKHLAIIDRRGMFRFVHTGTDGGINDRDQFTSSVLYLRKNEFFEEGEFIAADGIYRGDGPVMTSYNAVQLRNDPDGSRALFNLTFTEYRKGIENAFGRVQNWFPSLGNHVAKWSHDTRLLSVAFHAACRLHNWMLHVRNLNYDPTTDPSYVFSPYW